MVVMFGIANCDTIKKAKRWLADNQIDYSFHDYKKHGVPEDLIKSAIQQFGLNTVVNKRGTTYRKLSETTKDNLNEENSVKILQEHASMIKRPIIKTADSLIIGFDLENYEANLKHAEQRV